MKSTFMSKSSSRLHSHLVRSAVRFSFVCISALGLWGCDELSHYQPKTTQQMAVVEEPAFTTNQLLRGVYSDLVLNIKDVDNNDKVAFLRDLLEGLVIYDRQGHVIPAAAESWSTQDNKTWLFKMR